VSLKGIIFWKNEEEHHPSFIGNFTPFIWNIEAVTSIGFKHIFKIMAINIILNAYFPVNLSCP